MKFTNSRRPLFTAVMMASVTMAYAQKENMDTIADISHLSAYFVAGLMIAIFTMIFTNRLFYFRQKEISQQTRQLNTQLALVLDSNKIQVWTYDNDRRLFSLLSNHGEQQKTYSTIDFSILYDHDDFTAMMRQINTILRTGQGSPNLTVRGPKPKDPENARRLYQIDISPLQQKHRRQSNVLLGIQRDVTDTKVRQEKASSLALRYRTVFNSSLVDMVFYDAQGFMTDINDKACESFQVVDRQQTLASRAHIHDVPAYRDLDLEHFEQFHASSIVAQSDVVKPIGRLDGNQWQEGKTYYEQIVSPIHNDDGTLAGIIMAGRSITDMVQSQHHQKWASQQLKQKTSDIQAYIANINYSLRVSNVRLINYNPDTHELEVASDLRSTQYRLSQIRCIALVSPEDRRHVRGLFRRMDSRRSVPFSATLCTLFRDSQGRSVYLSFNIVPVTRKDGTISHYFGMCQNNTEMVYTEKRLREETIKAQETENLKSTFLMNMSHEIRTPLNAVIGFAELFNGEHDEADEPVFAEEIKRNTAELLQLVNDVLFISRLDANMIEFNYAPCDFALLFDSLCYMGLSAISPQVKATVENPYNHLTINIDEKNLGIVIQKVCAASTRYTTEGTIRAKYEYRHGELSISVEDSGRGLTEEQQRHLFDRFARSDSGENLATGLDMPIIKEIIEKMGGSLEIQSEPGKGTTAYIIIPCEMSSIEKKTEITA